MTGENVTDGSAQKAHGSNMLGHIEAYVLGEDYEEYIERMDSLIELNGILAIS